MKRYNNVTMKGFLKFLILLATPLAVSSCLSVDRDGEKAPAEKRLGFDIRVMRDGVPVAGERIATRSGMVDAEEFIATMDKSRPFGLVGVEKGTGTVLLDNAAVRHTNGGYSMNYNPEEWSIPSPVVFSAYYPHIEGVAYGEGNTTYSLTFGVNETDAGPLVSKTVERYISQINMLPLEFRHITNDIGYKICDVTPVKELQGLIHLRSLKAYNVASAGVYVNDLMKGVGHWSFSGYYRTVTVFNGDALLGVGSDNERFVGSTALVERMVDSHRYYAVPDELVPGKQYVEVTFDVDGFTYHGEHYGGIKDQVRRYMLYGLLEENLCVPGKQYTFHIGVDLSTVYRAIKFSATISDWETTIYENNDDF